MKKLLAIVLALMLLTVSAAFAETATVLTYSNPVITATENGQTETADLAGTKLVIAAGMMGEEPTVSESGDVVDDRVPTMVFDLEKDGENLLSGVLQVIDNRMVMDVEGISRPIAVDMSMAGDVAGQGYKTMFANLPEISKTKLPAFQGVVIPKLDLMAVASFLPMLGIEPETNGNTTSFELPAEMVNMVLQMILQQIPAEALQSTGALDALNSLLASGGFALKGDITDDGANAELVLGIYPVVEEGVTSEEPFLVISFSSAENSDVLNVEMSMGDQSMSLGQLALTSIPDQAELDLALNLMGGQMSLAGSLYPQDGAQVAALEVNAAGQKLTASLVYGEDNGADYSDFAIAVENQFAVDVATQTTSDGNGNCEGTSTVTIDSFAEPQRNVVINGEVAQQVVEGYTFRAVENADSAIDANSMTEEENAQLNQEFAEIGAKLMAAFGAVVPAA